MSFNYNTGQNTGRYSANFRINSESDTRLYASTTMDYGLGIQQTFSHNIRLGLDFSVFQIKSRFDPQYSSAGGRYKNFHSFFKYGAIGIKSAVPLWEKNKNSAGLALGISFLIDIFNNDYVIENAQEYRFSGTDDSSRVFHYRNFTRSNKVLPVYQYGFFYRRELTTKMGLEINITTGSAYRTVITDVVYFERMNSQNGLFTDSYGKSIGISTAEYVGLGIKLSYKL